MATHASGLILSSEPICDTAPLMQAAIPNVPIIQWDKFSAKHFFDKYDVLCLRGQDVLAGTGRDTETISMEDESVYQKFQQGDLIGIPQSASPAMRQAHIRLRTADLHDASLVQAGIRPGVGGAVKINTLIRRRRGLENYTYPHPLFEKILGISYGIIVFQEQVDQLLQTFCDFTAGEAEEIREKIHKFRAQDWAQNVREPIVSRCLKKRFSLSVAEHVFELVSGFQGYGFAQGHALAFAEISIRCVYCMENYPSEYFAALLSAQPAGYYGPATIANEARHKGVSILGPDVNESEELSTAQNRAIRIGLHQIYDLSQKTRENIVAMKPYENLIDFCEKTRPAANEIESLILCGALDRLHHNRRAMLWAIPDLVAASQFTSHQNALFTLCDIPNNVQDFTPYERAVLERAMLGMDIKTHLMAFERERVSSKGALTCKQAMQLKDGEKALVVGLAMRLRFPPTASGRRIVFFDLEDETALLNVTCFDETYQRDGHAIICSPFVAIKGVAQDRDGHTAFLAQRVFPYTLQTDRQKFAEERKAVHAEDFIMRKGR
jgi:error-prone DNA polymerase